MITPDAVESEIAAQKRLIKRLKREIFGVDKTFKSQYIKEFRTELTSYRSICAIDEVIERAAASDIVYFGDYHPLESSQKLVLTLMRRFTQRGRRVVLAMEMLYDYQQEILDRWMKGRISEEEFLEEIDYRREWGFSWRSYRRIFELAKNPFVPIFGIDAHMRDDLRLIRARDRFIANRLRNIRRFFPGYLLLVVIGESHLASGHLPAEVRKRCGGPLKETTIVQNIDELYWRLLREGREEAGAVRISAGRYCVFTTSPILKYQSYRRIIDKWRGEEEADRYIDMIAEMVENIVLFVAGDPGKLRITVRDGWQESLADLLPEVQCRVTYNSFSAFLRSSGVSYLGILANMEILRHFGVSYLPALNAILVVRFDPVYAAFEAGRFVVYALRDEVGRARKVFRTREDHFYAFVLEEALVHLGAKIVNPTFDVATSDPLLGVFDRRGVVRRNLPRHTLRETRGIASWLRYHFERDRSGALRRTARLEEFLGLPIRKRIFIVKTLGGTLGDALYRAHHQGRLTKEDILDLYRRRYVSPGEAKREYVSLVKRLGPFRGDWSALGGR